MKHLLISILLCISFLFLNCEGFEGPLIKNDYKLEVIDSFAIMLPFGSEVVNNSLKSYVVNRKEYLFKLNKKNNCVLQFEPKVDEDVVSHCFETSGPNGVGEIEGIAHKGGSEIIIASRNLNHYIYDIHTKNIQKISLRNELDVHVQGGVTVF